MGPDLRNELSQLLNKHCAENGSNTPDFILAQYLHRCLAAFDEAVQARSRWYGRHDAPGQKEPTPSIVTEDKEPSR